MNELTKFLVESVIGTEFDKPKTSVALFGGGFKPPTKGHLEVVNTGLKNNPEVSEIKILVGGGTRNGFTQDQAVKIWNLYNDIGFIKKPATIIPVSSPFTYYKEYLKDNPDDQVYVFIGSRLNDEGDQKDVKQRSEFVKKYSDNVIPVEVSTGGGVSGTMARELFKTDLDGFRNMFPENLLDQDFDKILDILNNKSTNTTQKPASNKTEPLSPLNENLILERIKLTPDEVKFSNEVLKRAKKIFQRGTPSKQSMEGVAVMPFTSADGKPGKVSFYVDHKGKPGNLGYYDKKKINDLEDDIIVLNGPFFTPAYSAIKDFVFSKVTGENPDKFLLDTIKHELIHVKDPGVNQKHLKEPYDSKNPELYYGSWTEFPAQTGEFLEAISAHAEEKLRNNPNDKEIEIFERILQNILDVYAGKEKAFYNKTEDFIVGGSKKNVVQSFIKDVISIGGEISNRNTVPQWDSMDTLQRYYNKTQLIKKYNPEGYREFLKDLYKEIKGIEKMTNFYLKEKAKELGQTKYNQIYVGGTGKLNEGDPKSQKKHKGKSAPFGSAYEPLNENATDIKNWVQKSLKSLGEKSISVIAKVGKEIADIFNIDVDRPKWSYDYIEILEMLEEYYDDNNANWPYNDDETYALAIRMAKQNDNERKKLLQQGKITQEDIDYWNDEHEETPSDRNLGYGIGQIAALGSPLSRIYRTRRMRKAFSLSENATYSSKIDYKQQIKDLTKHMIKKGMNILPLPRVIFKHGDQENASQFLGKTAYYSPSDMTVVLYTEGRHPKDIVRSFAHEMVHHIQNIEDRLENISTTNTMEDDNLNDIEREAYTKGNMTFRNWTDSLDGEEVTSLNENITPIKNLKVYHSTDSKFEDFSLDYAWDGFWFTDDLNSLKNKTAGASGGKYILTRYITLKNPANWDEYEKYSVGELIDQGYDGAFLPDEGRADYLVFNPKSISKGGEEVTSLNEKIVGEKIECDNCGWSWKIIDGGDDLFMCHKCGYDNEPENGDPFGLKAYARELVNETFKKSVTIDMDVVNAALEDGIFIGQETDENAIAIIDAAPQGKVPHPVFLDFYTKYDKYFGEENDERILDEFGLKQILTNVLNLPEEDIQTVLNHYEVEDKAVDNDQWYERHDNEDKKEEEFNIPGFDSSQDDHESVVNYRRKQLTKSLEEQERIRIFPTNCGCDKT